MENEFIIIGLIIANVVLNVFVLFSKSFFGKKGENLATKQDIKAITQKVEAVKSEFTKSNEIHRANLNLLVSSQLDFYKDERNAIVSFYEAYLEWRENALEITKSHGEYSEGNPIGKLSMALEDAYFKVSIADSRLDFFVDNYDITQLSTELIKQTLPLMGLADKALISFERISEEQAPLSKKTKLTKEEMNRFSQLEQEKTEIFRLYEQENSKNYKIVILLMDDFSEKSRDYLKRNKQILLDQNEEEFDR